MGRLDGRAIILKWRMMRSFGTLIFGFHLAAHKLFHSQIRTPTTEINIFEAEELVLRMTKRPLAGDERSRQIRRSISIRQLAARPDWAGKKGG
jgi:hypothetical protein